MFKFKTYFIIITLLFIYACSSTSFYQRQYLSGRYVDKIEKPDKINSNKTNELILHEYPLNADLKSNFIIHEINEDTIPKTAVDTTKSNTEAKQDEVIYFSPDTLKNIKKEDYKAVVLDYKQQLIFNDRLKQAGFRILYSWLLRVLGIILMIILVVSSATAMTTIPNLLFLGVLMLLIMLLSLFQNYRAFKILMEADKMRIQTPTLRNLGWYYVLSGLNFYLILVALYYLFWLLFYGVIMFFSALI